MGILSKTRRYNERAVNGWTDTDAWNACNYIAKVIGGTVGWLALNDHGVGSKYLPGYNDVALNDRAAFVNNATSEDWEKAVAAQRAERLHYAVIFKRYAEGDSWVGPDAQDCVDRWGGVRKDELDDALNWFVENFENLWD